MEEYSPLTMTEADLLSEIESAKMRIAQCKAMHWDKSSWELDEFMIGQYQRRLPIVRAGLASTSIEAEFDEIVSAGNVDAEFEALLVEALFG
jgi:hypothetical protein